MAIRKRTDFIVVHCSATPANMDIGVKEIRQWHTAKQPKGNGWSDIGYAEVIRRDGTRETGRGLDAVGAHVAGYNSNSVGICLVGGVDKAGKDGKPVFNFTKAQEYELIRALRAYKKRWPGAKILGHRDLNPGKACPSFDVAEWLKGKAI